jgi:3-phenylpropionate/trans-cinnamate dioxygenase ferredoxin reductase component
VTVSPQHIVIIGAGHAGGCAAGALRGAGFSGRVILLGVEAFPPYERPPLSKQVLAGAMPIEKTYLRPPQWYAENNVDLRLNTRVLYIDRASQRLKLSTGDTLTYDAALLATGARPRTLPFAKMGDARIYYLRDIKDALALREQLKPGVRLAVIGAGFIGLEVAATARQCGCSVVVLEVASHPLARVAPVEIGEFVAELHRRSGVELRLNCSVRGIDNADRCCAIEISDGGTIEADIVVVGIGAAPDTALAAEAGLTVDDGIVVDEYGRTSDPSIFAAGDVTKHFNPLLRRSIRLEAWQNAQNQAMAVAKVMAGGADAYSEVPWVWTDQYDLNLQVAGSPARWDEIVFRGDPGTGRFLVFQLLDGRPVGAFAINSGRDMRFARTLVARGAAVAREKLTDAKISLQDLCR